MSKTLTPTDWTPPTHDGVSRRDAGTWITYGCGHVEREFRGRMSDELRERTLTACRTVDCPQCVTARQEAERTPEQLVADGRRARELWA